jgi:quercetin dioxygenase-like cupin family protein
MSDATKVTVTNLRELSAQNLGWGTIRWLCNRELVPNAQQTFGLVHILPGQQNPLHYHPNREELLYVMSGECEHSFDGDWVHLSPGMIICIPAGVRHQLVNRGWDPVRILKRLSFLDQPLLLLKPDLDPCLLEAQEAQVLVAPDLALSAQSFDHLTQGGVILPKV